jgi:hypothetical protein
MARGAEDDENPTINHFKILVRPDAGLTDDRWEDAATDYYGAPQKQNTLNMTLCSGLLALVRNYWLMLM